MEKFYGYTYGGSGLAAQRPMSKDSILRMLEGHQKQHGDISGFSIFELIPVKPVPVMGFKLERK